MRFLDKQDRQRVSALLEQASGPVEISAFIRRDDCPFCQVTRQLLGELAELSRNIRLSVYDIREHGQLASGMGVELLPATVISHAGQGRMYYFGFPWGYEFDALLQLLLPRFPGRAELEETAKALLQQVGDPLRLQVFVTTTCPQSPQMVVLAAELLRENSHLSLEVIEANEFPWLARRYQVRRVPHTVVAGKAAIAGVLPQVDFVKRVVDIYKQTKN